MWSIMESTAATALLYTKYNPKSSSFHKYSVANASELKSPVGSRLGQRAQLLFLLPAGTKSYAWTSVARRTTEGLLASKILFARGW